MAYTTKNLIESVKSRIYMPLSQSTVTEIDILRYADEELQTNIVPLMLGVREEYFVNYKDFNINSSNEYEIPQRAVGLKLKDVTARDASGNEISMAKYQLEDSHDTYNDGDFTTNSYSFTLINNKVKVLGNISGDASIRLYYFERPSELILSSAGSRIETIDRVNNSITVQNLPNTFTVGESVDLVKNRPGYETLLADAKISNIGGTQVDFSSSTSIPDDLQVGDWLCLAEQAPVIQVPKDIYPLLSQLVIIRILEALNDPALGAAMKNMEMMRANVLDLLAPRVEGEAKKIIARYNPLSYLTGRKGYRF